MLFFGEYEHSIDPKNRLAVPAEFRSHLTPEKLGAALVLSPGANGLLWAWPEKTFEEIASAFGGSLLPDPKLAQFERTLFTSSVRVELDSAGRIQLPKKLTERYGLSGTIVVLGVGRHLELSPAEAWKAQRVEDEAAMPHILEHVRTALQQRQGGSNLRA